MNEKQLPDKAKIQVEPKRSAKRWLFAALAAVIAALVVFLRPPAVFDAGQGMRQEDNFEEGRKKTTFPFFKGSSSDQPAHSPVREDSSATAGIVFDGEYLSKSVVSSDVMTRHEALERFKAGIAALESSGAGLSELLRLFQKMDGADDSFAPLVAASGALGTPAVQAVLRQIVSERTGDWRTFAAVIPVLGGVASPTSETMDFLAEQARAGEGDFSSAAALALGACVHTLAQTEPERGARILQSYVSVLEDSRADPEDIKESLAVLGNAGLVSTAPAILPLTRHERADVRAEAVMALRFIRTPQTEARLLEIVQNDTDTDVRLSVTDALIHAPLQMDVRAVMRGVSEDASSTPALLREKCIDVLMHLELPETERQALRVWALRLYEREKNERVRAKLQSAAEEFARPD